MFHPLVPDLTSLSDDELAKKISELSSRINTAHKINRSDAIQQLYLFMESYQYEYQNRQRKLLDEINKKSGELGIDSIIDIN